MSGANDQRSPNRWVFGLEEIPAGDRDEDGTDHPVAPAFGMTVIRAPEGTPQALHWAAEDIVMLCGPDFMVPEILLQWLRVEAGDEQQLGVESCLLERVSDNQIRLHSHYKQWEDLVVPIADVRRMFIDMMHFCLREARHPLPAERIRRLAERDWKHRRSAE